MFGIITSESIELTKGVFVTVNANSAVSKDKHLQNQLAPLASQLTEFEQLLSSSVEELLLENNGKRSSADHTASHPLSTLDYRAIKDTLKKKDVGLVCAVLKALRWRVSRAENVFRRREAIIQLTSNNMLEYPLFTNLLDRKNRNITEHLLSLANTVASEYLGRSYLIENTQLVRNVIQVMRTETSDTFIRRNCLGVLQKLSLRKRPQEILIQSDIIKWALSVLSNEKATLSTYSLEYLAALILNLSLRTIGKNKFEEVRFSIMSFLRDYINHQNIDIRTYVNGTMYSLFSRPSLRALALEMGFEERLKALAESSDEAFAKRYEYVLQQLLSDGAETTLSELNEDEHDVDLVNEEEFWAEEENENAPEVEYEIEGEELLARWALSGEEAEKQQQVVSTIMEETISQSRLEMTRGGRPAETEQPRASTPFKGDAARAKRVGFDRNLTESEVKERSQAFQSRPKIGM